MQLVTAFNAFQYFEVEKFYKVIEEAVIYSTVHWMIRAPVCPNKCLFNLVKFSLVFKEVDRILSPGGVLAVCVTHGMKWEAVGLDQFRKLRHDKVR